MLESRAQASSCLPTVQIPKGMRHIQYPEWETRSRATFPQTSKISTCGGGWVSREVWLRPGQRPPHPLHKPLCPLCPLPNRASHLLRLRTQWRPAAVQSPCGHVSPVRERAPEGEPHPCHLSALQAGYKVQCTQQPVALPQSSFCAIMFFFPWHTSQLRCSHL